MKSTVIAVLSAVLLAAQGFTVHGARAAGAPDRADASATLKVSTVLNLDDLKSNPDKYSWFDFRPNLKKLILSGDADTEHVSILWYTVTNGSVGLHYHAKTESVYVIEGTQTDAKGTYPTGSLYFNPPGSGHAIKDSSGFFILAYASPPDFKNTASIGEYQPVRVETASADLERKYVFEKAPGGATVHRLPLDPKGGMSSELIRATGAARYSYRGNYLLPLRGNCEIEGQILARGMLVVANTVEPRSYAIRASQGAGCLALGVSFTK